MEQEHFKRLLTIIATLNYPGPRELNTIFDRHGWSNGTSLEGYGMEKFRKATIFG